MKKKKNKTEQDAQRSLSLSAQTLDKVKISQQSLDEFILKQAEQIYEETKALRGSRKISHQTYLMECGPLVDYD